MNEIKLNQEQINLLLKIIDKQKIQFQTKVIVDDINKEIIVDILSNYFNKYGIDNQYEPNSLGMAIESLMDKFII